MVADKKLSDFVMRRNGLFDHDLCNRIINAAEQRDILDLEYAHLKRENYIALIKYAGFEGLNQCLDLDVLCTLNHKLNIAFDLYMESVQDTYMKGNPFCYGPDIWIRKYGRGGKLRNHIDSAAITALIGLNSEYEGGEIHFWRGELRQRIGCGDLLMFPGNFMFEHTVDAIKEGERYVLMAQWHNPVITYTKRDCDDGLFIKFSQRNGEAIS